MKVIVAGASGEIGKALIQLLILDQDISLITILGRKNILYSTPKIKSLIVDFEQLKFLDHMQAEVLFCCLGTTMKKAKSKENFRKVDQTYISHLGQWAIDSQIEQFHVVSALGANPNSKIFYNRVKGEMENQIASLPFVSTYFYQPALLDSERVERRPLERMSIYLFRAINPLLIGLLKKYRSISVNTVAQGMLSRSKKPSSGTHFISSERI